MIIEFIGLPRAGKTEQTERLSRFFESRKKKVRIITDREIEREIKFKPEDSFNYNLDFFRIIDMKIRKAKEEIIILDRGFIDGLAWTYNEFELKNLNKSEFDELYDYLSSSIEQIDYGIFIKISKKSLIQRHKKKGEKGKSDKYVLEERYLNGLIKSYEKLENELENSKKVLVVDGELAPEEIENKIKKLF